MDDVQVEGLDTTLWRAWRVRLVRHPPLSPLFPPAFPAFRLPSPPSQTVADMLRDRGYRVAEREQAFEEYMQSFGNARCLLLPFSVQYLPLFLFYFLSILLKISGN